MEKFSKWRDPSTGIHPFLPLIPPTTSSFLTLLIAPFALLTAILRIVLLILIASAHILLVNGLCTFLTALHPTLMALTTRSALFILGHYWITDELVSPKRGGISSSSSGKGGSVAQLIRPPKKGDLVLSNWTSYIDILYLAYKLPKLASVGHAESFAQFPVAEEIMTAFVILGTGSAASIISPRIPFVGYTIISFTQLLLRTGSLPPTSATIKPTTIIFSTIKELHKSLQKPRPIALLPEATTGNGRALLKFAEGVLSEPPPLTGIVWCTYIKHISQSNSTPGGISATCPLPKPWEHLLSMIYSLPFGRSMTVRTLHPSASPSSPSFLPSEVVANAGTSGSGTNGGIGRLDEKSIWREAYSITLAETGRARRVGGMGWVEKAAFLDYYFATQKKVRR